MRQALFAGGLGGGSPAQRGARGAEPPRKCQHAQRQECEERRPHSRRNETCRKDKEASTQVVIRDLFCKRRRAMLQYGTPDWARPCLARLTPWGFCVGTAGSETHRSRSPQAARTALICCTLFRRASGHSRGSLLSIWFFYPQKGAQATKLAGQCRPILISHPF
jgi:hypothetical protein